MSRPVAVLTIMSEEEILSSLRGLFGATIAAQHLGAVDVDEISAETHLLSLPLDSLALVALMANVEEAFAIYVSDEAAFEFRTVGDLIAHIHNKLEAKARRAAARGT